MRFSIRKKIIVLGTAISFLLMLVAFLTSFLIYQNRAKNVFSKSLDNSIEELDYSVGNEEAFSSMKSIIANAYPSILESVKADKPIFASRDAEFDYYQSMYSSIYPSTGAFGMSYMKIRDMTSYLSISSRLAEAAISAGGEIAYAGIIVPKNLTGSSDKFVYLFDSKFRFDDYKEGNFFGSDVALDKLSIDYIDDDDVVVNKQKARMLTYDLGTIKELFDFMGRDTSAYSDDELSLSVDITCFIEYDTAGVTEDIKFFALIEGISLIAAAILFVIIYILIAQFVIVKNVVSLTNAANEFTDKVRTGEIDEAVIPKVNSSDEIGILSKAYVTLEEEIIDYTEKIKKATHEKEMMNAELEVATKIQLEALPNNSLNDSNVLLEASIKSAKEVGGDFYDYFYIDNNHLAIIISDVSGKGIPAALFMMKSKELIKSKLQAKKTLEEVCFEVNNELLHNNEAGLFITAFIGVLDLNERRLELISAGHEKPFIMSNGRVERLDVKSNFILGGIEDYQYQKDTVNLNEGDRIFLHTDGLNESINSTEEEFGYDRILNNLNNNYNLGLKDILNNMSKELDEFVDNAIQFDDITMIVMELKKNKLEFNYHNPDYEIIDEIVNQFNDYYSYLDKKILSKVGIIVDEILNNYISYEKKDDLIINVSFNCNDDNVIISFENNGDEFNPLLKEKKYIENDKDLTPGGLGITMVKELASNLSYERNNGFNKLIVKLNIK